MSLEEDGKEVARKERATPQCDQLMKQFCKLESSVDPRKYKNGHEVAFSNLCLSCDGFGTVGTKGDYQRSDKKCGDCDGTGKKVA